MNIYNNRTLSDDMLICKLRQAAKIYNTYAEKDLFLVYAKSKKATAFSYEFHAGVENFQHLAGIKSPIGAEKFYYRCLDNVNILKRSEIVPNDCIKATSSKIDVLPMAVDLKNAKAYRFGSKDLITMYNSFEMAIGNTQCVMGFDKRTYRLPIPVTVMARSLYDFCSSVSSISLIMTKERTDVKYKHILYEVTNNIIQKANYDNNILSRIDESLLDKKMR